MQSQLSTQTQPEGTLLLRTLAMPADTNINGDIFGGWIMAQMDMAGGILAKEIAGGRTVTVAVNSMTFLRPVSTGDAVCCYGKCMKIGNSSIQIKLEVWVKKLSSDPIGARYRVTEGIFTYVAIDAEGKSRKVTPSPSADFSC